MKFQRWAFVALFLCPLIAEKRPLSHKDYDSWRHIQDQRLSDDGKFLAYALFPQEGDGELVVLNLATGKEWRQPIGELPPPAPPNFADPLGEDAPPTPRGITIAFTRDSHTLVSSAFPPRSEVQKAKLEKKKPEEMPKNALIVLDLASGAVFRSANVKSFQVPTQGD